MNIRKFKHIYPRIAPSAFIDPTALVVGDVDIDEDASIWPMVTVRGDVNHIHIGKRTNIQDGSVLHVTAASNEEPNGYALTIGDDITVGHRVILHGCTIEDHCLIGMGAILMDGVYVEKYNLIGAGSLIPPGKKLDSGFLWLGSPVKKIRSLTDEEKKQFHTSVSHYVSLKNQHK